MKNGHIKLTTVDFDTEFPLSVTDPDKTIAECEARFGMTSDEFQNTDKMLQFKRTMENTFYILMWNTALNQVAGRGWEPFAEGVIGSVVSVTGEQFAQNAQAFLDATSVDAATLARAFEDGEL